MNGAGPILVIRYERRGTVTWTPGRLDFTAERGDRIDELRRAIEALVELEAVDLAVGIDVREALLTVAGARILVEDLGPLGSLRVPITWQRAV
jgi:hypothetical protein